MDSKFKQPPFLYCSKPVGRNENIKKFSRQANNMVLEPISVPPTPIKCTRCRAKKARSSGFCKSCEGKPGVLSSKVEPVHKIEVEIEQAARRDWELASEKASNLAEQELISKIEKQEELIEIALKVALEQELEEICTHLRSDTGSQLEASLNRAEILQDVIERFEVELQIKKVTFQSPKGLLEEILEECSQAHQSLKIVSPHDQVSSREDGDLTEGNLSQVTDEASICLQTTQESNTCQSGPPSLSLDPAVSLLVPEVTISADLCSEPSCYEENKCTGYHLYLNKILSISLKLSTDEPIPVMRSDSPIKDLDSLESGPEVDMGVADNQEKLPTLSGKGSPACSGTPDPDGVRPGLGTPLQTNACPKKVTDREVCGELMDETTQSKMNGSDSSLGLSESSAPYLPPNAVVLTTPYKSAEVEVRTLAESAQESAQKKCQGCQRLIAHGLLCRTCLSTVYDEIDSSPIRKLEIAFDNGALTQECDSCGVFLVYNGNICETCLRTDDIIECPGCEVNFITPLMKECDQCSEEGGLFDTTDESDWVEEQQELRKIRDQDFGKGGGYIFINGRYKYTDVTDEESTGSTRTNSPTFNNDSEDSPTDSDEATEESITDSDEVTTESDEATTDSDEATKEDTDSDEVTTDCNEESEISNRVAITPHQSYEWSNKPQDAIPDGLPVYGRPFMGRYEEHLYSADKCNEPQEVIYDEDLRRRDWIESQQLEFCPICEEDSCIKCPGCLHHVEGCTCQQPITCNVCRREECDICFGCDHHVFNCGCDREEEREWWPERREYYIPSPPSHTQGPPTYKERQEPTSSDHVAHNSTSSSDQDASTESTSQDDLISSSQFNTSDQDTSAHDSSYLSDLEGFISSQNEAINSSYLTISDQDANTEPIDPPDENLVLVLEPEGSGGPLIEVTAADIGKQIPHELAESMETSYDSPPPSELSRSTIRRRMRKKKKKNKIISSSESSSEDEEYWVFNNSSILDKSDRVSSCSTSSTREERRHQRSPKAWKYDSKRDFRLHPVWERASKWKTGDKGCGWRCLFCHKGGNSGRVCTECGRHYTGCFGPAQSLLV